MTIIITGGAGFIGSHVVRLFVNKYSEYRIINVDVLIKQIAEPLVKSGYGIYLKKLLDE
jgi:dTDP-D-glucose 4,6-dehydratase